MKLLKDILPPEILAANGSGDSQVKGLTLDSRACGPENNLFVALRGTLTDGHDYIDKAIENGANIILCEEKPQKQRAETIYLVCSDSATALGELASAFYDHPSKEIKVIGITGTNGKTTVGTLLHRLFSDLGERCGLLSTVHYVIGDKVIPSTHTTPDAIRLQGMLREMVDADCSYCFMEVSSHAIAQHRIGGMRFTGAIFTNITHDHLDYHKTFKNYLYTKKRLFDGLDHEAFAVINKDDKNASVMVQNCLAPVYTYSLKRGADFKAKILEHDFNGMLLSINDLEAWHRLVGEFNAYNMLAVYATAFLSGFEPLEIVTQLSRLNSVKGRFQYLESSSGLRCIVDYAHTPDALENVLKTINTIRSKNEELITVVGCGGNRDKEKRPIMAKVAAELSSRVILTSDNPRNEDPAIILKEMEAGIPPQFFKKALTIQDRENAIKTAIQLSAKGDIILIAGKGHENYQEIKGVRFPFDDAQVFTQLSANTE